MLAPAQGASIALFMLLAALVTPDPPPGGVGLRGAARPGLKAASMPPLPASPLPASTLMAGPRSCIATAGTARSTGAEVDAVACPARLGPPATAVTLERPE